MLFNWISNKILYKINHWVLKIKASIYWLKAKFWEQPRALGVDKTGLPTLSILKVLFPPSIT